jgi:hypothetical protein
VHSTLRSTLRNAARLLAVLATELGLVGALVAAGRRPALRIPLDDLEGWLRHAPPADVLMALLRWPALVGALWLLGSTLAYAVAAGCRAPRALRAVRWSTFPAVRRVVDATFAVGVVTGALLAPTAAGAATPPPSATGVRDGRAPAPTTPTPTLAPVFAPAPPPPTTAPLPDASTLASEVIVAPGDSLWELAATRVATTSGRPRAVVDDDEIGPYWLRVCEENRNRITSGDLNLIVPGERVVLPPLT